MTEGINFAIVGAGDIAKYHAKAIELHPEANLVAVASPNLDKAAELAQGFDHVELFQNVQDMLTWGKFDVLCICTPSGIHHEAAIAAANAKKHILCEKPLDITAEHMTRMIEAARKNDVKLGVVLQRRLMPAIKLVKQAIEQGKIGRLVMGNAYLKYYRSPEYYKSSDWKGTKKLDGGGALMNQGVHGIDVLLYMLGDVESLYAYTDHLSHDIEVEDTAVIAMKFRNGAFGTVQGATSVYPGQETRFEIHGDKGSLEFTDEGFKQWSLMDHDEPLPEVDDVLGLAATKSSTQISTVGHEFYVADMIEAIKEDRDPFVTGEEARKSVDFVLAVYESARLRKEIKLPQY